MRPQNVTLQFWSCSLTFGLVAAESIARRVSAAFPPMTHTAIAGVGVTFQKSSSASRKSSKPFRGSESRPAYVIVGIARSAVEDVTVCSIRDDSTFRYVDFRI